MDELRLCWKPDHSTPIRWVRCTAAFFVTLLTLQWEWHSRAHSHRANPLPPFELKINFFRPVWQALLRANGKVVRRGRSLGYVECDITDERGQLVAKAASTCLVLRGEEAKGR